MYINNNDCDLEEGASNKLTKFHYVVGLRYKLILLDKKHFGLPIFQPMI